MATPGRAGGESALTRYPVNKALGDEILESLPKSVAAYAILLLQFGFSRYTPSVTEATLLDRRPYIRVKLLVDRFSASLLHYTRF